MGACTTRSGRSKSGSPEGGLPPQPLSPQPRPILTWRHPEPPPARAVQRALLGVAEQAGDLPQRKVGFGEIATGVGPALPFDHLLARRALLGEAALQRARMHPKLGGDHVDAALPRRQQVAGEIRRALRQPRRRRQVARVEVLPGDAPGRRVRTLDGRRGKMGGKLEPHHV